MRNVFITILLIAALILGGYLLLSRGGQDQVEDDVVDLFTNSTSTDSFQIASSEVNYYENVTGYLARPEGSGPFPAVVLIHEWWGLNDDMRDMAERFAQEGYVALAVDLYNGSTTTDSTEARELSGAVRENTEGAFDNLEAAVSYLEVQPFVDDERLASVGWCFGGGWAYQMAANDLGTEASVMYYGQFDPEDDFEMMRSSILGHFGEEDASIAIDDVREFEATLENASSTHQVYIYPNVGHGFANERGGTNLEYNEDAAETAWDRTMEFLNRVLES